MDDLSKCPFCGSDQVAAGSDLVCGSACRGSEIAAALKDADARENDLRSALAHYADPANWEPDADGEYLYCCEHDGAFVARHALADPQKRPVLSTAGPPRPDQPTTQDELKAAVLKAAVDNHTWINAFALVRPSDELLRDIGKLMVARLRDRSLLLPAWHGEEGDGPLTDMQKLTHVLYLSVNAS